MKLFTLAFSVSFLSITVLGQTSDSPVFQDPGHMSCSYNAAAEAYFAEHPEARVQAEQEKAAFNAQMREGNSTLNRDADFIIPVVFHIIHINGPENISDDQVESAIEVMNEDFSATTPDIGDVHPDFADIVGNPNVEFRLAKLDPDGNCTNGINRVYSTGTNAGGDNVKTGDASTWGRTKYLNIWVVNNIEGSSAGYAYLPWGAPQLYDGIIIEDAYVGRIGTGTPNRSHALSHEAGHWAGLLHTWGSSDTPGLAGNCGTDDGLSDTPNTIGWSDCDLDGISCGSLDNVENFMDYAYCYKMFTEDQAGIIGEVLSSGPSGRYLLNSATNLANTGVLAPDVICLADFNTDEEPTICEGNSLVFNDASYNGITSWEWTFEGGTASADDVPNPEVTYTTPGTFDVVLTVSNANGSETITKSNFVNVLPIGENDVPFQEGFESFSSLENNGENWFVINSIDSDIQWELSTDAAYSGTKSVFVNGRINNNGEVESLVSPTYDLTDINGGDGEEVHISFKYAHAKRNSGSDDVLKVMVSRNCGDTWSVRKTIDIDELPTVSGNVSQSFMPESQDEWQEVIIDNVISSYLTDEFRVKFEFTSWSGNNIYLDDINIYNSIEGPLSLTSISFASEAKLYPNPSQGISVLEYNLEKSINLQIDILDLSGRIVSTVYSGNQATGNQRVNIYTNGLDQGVYFIRLISEGEQFTTKIIRQ